MWITYASPEVVEVVQPQLETILTPAAVVELVDLEQRQILPSGHHLRSQ
jgi:hypothetical protein